MPEDIWVLTATAGSIALFHTLLGPDHYLPFIMMSRSRQWSRSKTTLITLVCGGGHVLGSVLLGLVGVSVGIGVEQLELVESARGTWAAWGLIAFGLTYMVYGVFRAVRNRPHSHAHVHPGGTLHVHEHTHHEEHAHVHEGRSARSSPVPWALFVIFVFGPCEPLIPILMYPAAQHSLAGMVLVTAVFGIVTIATMLGVVLAGIYGLSFAPLTRMERYSHAIAGLAILACGSAVQFLGL